MITDPSDCFMPVIRMCMGFFFFFFKAMTTTTREKKTFEQKMYKIS